jgi:hypothetical protein
VRFAPASSAARLSVCCGGRRCVVASSRGRGRRCSPLATTSTSTTTTAGELFMTTINELTSVNNATGQPQCSVECTTRKDNQSTQDDRR